MAKYLLGNKIFVENFKNKVPVLTDVKIRKSRKIEDISTEVDINKNHI